MTRGVWLTFPTGTPLPFGTAATEFSVFCNRLYTEIDRGQPHDEHYSQDQHILKCLLPATLHEMITWAKQTWAQEFDIEQTICVYCKVNLKICEARPEWKALCAQDGISIWPVWFGVDKEWYEMQERHQAERRLKSMIKRWEYNTHRKKALLQLFACLPGLPDLVKDNICNHYPKYCKNGL